MSGQRRRRSTECILVGSVVLLSFVIAIGDAECAQIPPIAEVRARVRLRERYKIDTDVHVEVRVGQAVRFSVDENYYDIAEFLIYPASDGGIWVYGLDRAGVFLERSSTNFRRRTGNIRQLGGLPCAAIMKWKLRDDVLSIDLVISTDKARNRDERNLALKNRMAMGGRSANWHLPPEVTETERIAGFVRFWSEVKYNFAFFHQVPELDWDQVLIDYLPRIQGAQTTYEYFDLLRECAALLKDGHTEVWGPSDDPLFCPAIRVRGISGKAIIEDVMLPEESKSPELSQELAGADLRPGEEITRIDGRTVSEILQEDLYPYISASTPQSRDLEAFPRLLCGEYKSVAVLTVCGLDGTERQVRLKRRGAIPGRQLKGFVFQKLDHGLVYVNLPTFGNESAVEQFKGVFEQIQKAKGLVIDVRENGGGDSDIAFRIVSLLIERPISGTSWQTRQYMPAFRAWGRKEKWYEGKPDIIEPREKDPFLGPVVVLTGVGTFSAAEDFAVALHASKRARVVGGRTAGSTGQPLHMSLPAGGGARICTKRDTYPDGREFVGVGVIPDVEICPAPADIAAKRDVVLERAVEELKRMVK